VTVFLLTYIRQKISDTEVQSEIEKTIDFVERRTEE
jgi:hypothetical protein